MPNASDNGKDLILGLDIGSNSIGWAIFEAGKEEAPRQGTIKAFDPETGEFQPVDTSPHRWQPTSLVDWGVLVPQHGIEQDGKAGVIMTKKAERGRLRRQRRNLYRRRQRRNRLVSLLSEVGMLPSDKDQRFSFLTSSGEGGERKDPYALRRKAIGPRSDESDANPADHRLSEHEIGKILHHFVRGRHFLSTRDLMLREIQLDIDLDELPDTQEVVEEAGIEVSDEAKARKAEETAFKMRMRMTHDEMVKAGARTVGEFLADQIDRGKRVRINNAIAEKFKGKKDFDVMEANEGFRISRQMIEDEFEQIWEYQKQFYPELMTPELKAKVYEIIFYQRPLSSKAHLRGSCSFFANQRRAMRASLEAQRLSIWQYLHNLRVSEEAEEVPAPSAPVSNVKRAGKARVRRKYRPLTKSERAKLFQVLDAGHPMQWDAARALLELAPDAVFSDEETGKSKRKKAVIAPNRTAALVLNVLGEKWEDLPEDRREALVQNLLYARSRKALFRWAKREFDLDDRTAAALCTIEEFPEGYAQFSTKALRRVNARYAESEEAIDINEAIKRTGLRYADAGQENLNGQGLRLDLDLYNPVVDSAYRYTARLINAIENKYGRPRVVKIELARDATKTGKQLKEETSWQAGNEREREEAAKLLREHGFPVNRGNIVKVRLWKEANERSPFNPERPVSLADLIWECEIEHIVPRGLSADDSLTNKTIAWREDNMTKGMKTPFQTWGSDFHRWDAIKSFLNSRELRGFPKGKRRLILDERDPREREPEFVGRQLSDTRYAARLIRDELQRVGYDVIVCNGSSVAEVRKRWGLDKFDELVKPQWIKDKEDEEKRKREEAGEERKGPYPKKVRADHRHHAIDAAAVACMNARVIHRLATYFKARSDLQDMLRSDLYNLKGKLNRGVITEAEWEKQKSERHEQYREERDAHPIAKHLDPPYPEFELDLRERLDSVNIWHEPTRGIEGSLHEATALDESKRPSQEAIDIEIARRRQKGLQVGSTIVYDKKFIRLDRNGKILQAYALGNNHHAVIWESKTLGPKGVRERRAEIVTMIEAARRLESGEPLFEADRPDWRVVAHICKNDIVEWEDGTYRRVTKFSPQGNGGADMLLLPLTYAAIPDNKSSDFPKFRKQSKTSVNGIQRRVSLNFFGEVVEEQGASGAP